MARKKYTHSPYWRAKKSTIERSYVADALKYFGLYELFTSDFGEEETNERGSYSSFGSGSLGASSSYGSSRRWSGKSSKPSKMLRKLAKHNILSPYGTYTGGGGFNYYTYKYGAGLLIFGAFVVASVLSVAIIADIGVIMGHTIKRIKDPKEREEMKREFLLELRKLIRARYYEEETKRRRALARARRKVNRRYTLSPAPTPEQILEAWNHRKDSKEAMIKLGGILQDLECYVDNTINFFDGDIVSRKRGIRGWITDNLPELDKKYKTLMRYKAMAIKLRQATNTRDPDPTEDLLKGELHPIVKEILGFPQETFSIIIEVLEHYLSPDRVYDG